MFKTLLKVGTTFALLLGCYFGYVRAFDIVVRQFQDRRHDELIVFTPRDSRSKKQSQDLVRRSVGSGHWAVELCAALLQRRARPVDVRDVL